MRNKRSILVSIVTLSVALFFAESCEYETIKDIVVPPVTTPVSFNTDLKKNFSEKGCTGCHNGSYKFELNVANFTSMNLINTTSPETSGLIITLKGQNSSHPVPISYSADVIAQFVKWMKDGAENNK